MTPLQTLILYGGCEQLADLSPLAGLTSLQTLILSQCEQTGGHVGVLLPKVATCAEHIERLVGPPEIKRIQRRDPPTLLAQNPTAQPQHLTAREEGTLDL